MPKNISARVRKKYFLELKAGTKNRELRANSEYWLKKFGKGKWEEYIGGIITFVCGKESIRFRIEHIEIGRPEYYLGRPLSDQGKKDIPTILCWCIHLGDEVDAKGNNVGGS